MGRAKDRVNSERRAVGAAGNKACAVEAAGLGTLGQRGNGRARRASNERTEDDGVAWRPGSEIAELVWSEATFAPTKRAFARLTDIVTEQPRLHVFSRSGILAILSRTTNINKMAVRRGRRGSFSSGYCTFRRTAFKALLHDRTPLLRRRS